MNRILKAYLKRLTNLSTRNKSLLLARLPTEQFLDVNDLDFLLGKSSFDTIAQLVQHKSRIALCDSQDPRYERVNEISKRLRKISRTEHFIEEERGSRDLYVGYPFIRGKLADGTPIHAPLLFFPVTLNLDREQWCLSERDEAGIILNRSFALAYAHFNEVQIGDDILEKNFEDFPKDFLEFRTHLYEWLKETPFRINFNQQLFEDKLVAFDAQKSSDLSRTEKNGELKLYPEAVLGIFPQAGSYLVPDYNRLLEQYAESPFQMLLVGADENEFKDSEFLEQESAVSISIKEEEILTPFAIDESQEEIIRSVKAGKSVVVQGPPGSGKSQLICNLIADFAARGKRVLLVCQKRAALDVVYQRLKTIGMDPFVALIHDFKNDRADLYRQFATQIEEVEAYRQQNYSLDAVFLERQFTQESRKIDKTVDSLLAFRTALFGDQDCGVPVKELYLTSDQSAPNVNLANHFRDFLPGNCEDFKVRLKTFAQYATLLNNEHPWNTRKSFAGFGLIDLRSMEKMFLDWPEAFSQLNKRFGKITDEPFDKIYISNRKEILERLENIGELLQEKSVFEIFKRYLISKEHVHERLAFIRQATDALEGFLAEDGIEVSLSAPELPYFRSQLRKAVEAKKSSVSGLWWDAFSGDKKVVVQVASRNGLTASHEHLLLLEIKVNNRIELEGWMRNELLDFSNHLPDQKAGAEQQYLDYFQLAEKAADASSRATLEPWYKILTHWVLSSGDLNVFQFNITWLTDWLKSWDNIEKAMAPYLLPKQINKLIDEPEGYSQLLLDALRQDFDSIVDMDRIQEEMTLPEREVTQVVSKFCEKSAIVTPKEVIDVFENSLRLAWISHIEDKYPDLRAVTSLKMQQWEEQLQNSITSKQQLSSDIVSINLREKTYEDVEKNRLGNRVTYRELNHQVTKKRKIWPIRKLIEAHQQELFSLVPCWMASPEAVSAIFPMGAGLFDLVIFDEASQCYAEFGLPAAFRGKQIVITGDSRQLPPSDLYKVRYEEKAEDDEIPVALEIESLLDLAAQTLDEYQLSGHYRSLSLDLIDFSNQHFYKNSLRLLPDFNRVNERQNGIEYLKVEGVWEQNRNAIEVEKVIELLKSLSYSAKTIGVVTFNFYQQQAVQEAVERENITVKDLFIKNIENVQGDERDIIIFTVGYAQDENGRLSMQFGSLNMQGGENRLNVAITRAREKIYFITSLLPSQLQTDQTANAGPKLLKAYMEYAWNVSEGNFQPKPIETKSYRSDWLLKEKLAATTPGYVKELPFGDITIKEEGVYKGLVLTDDDLYHQSKSSKEPHAYLPLLLRLKNWPFKRIYSREYWAKSGDFKAP